MSVQIFELLLHEAKWKNSNSSMSTHVCRYLHGSAALSGHLTVELCPLSKAHNKWTQPCITLNVPIYTNTHSEQSRVPSMCLLFCSGAGMCGNGWQRHTGQLTAGTGCWSNWTWPQRDEFPPTLCTPSPHPIPSGNNGLVWLHSHKVFSFSSSLADYNNQDLLHSRSKQMEEVIHFHT